jgi:hypothetical protein
MLVVKAILPLSGKDVRCNLSQITKRHWGERVAFTDGQG